MASIKGALPKAGEMETSAIRKSIERSLGWAGGLEKARLTLMWSAIKILLFPFIYCAFFKIYDVRTF